jgi:hypothetical protein
MCHFETIDSKNKKVTFENKDLKELLKVILNYNNGQKNDDELSIIFENSINTQLLDISEKYLKHHFEIIKIRKTTKLDKAIKDFNNLNLESVSSITFKNKCHEGIITIWDEEIVEAVPESSDEDEQDEQEQDEQEQEQEQESNSENEDFNSDNYSESSLESIHMSINSVNIQKENKKLRNENKKLKEQVQLLKSFVITYRDMCIKGSSIPKSIEDI